MKSKSMFPVRWLMREDLKLVVLIDEQSFSEPLTEGQFRAMSRKPHAAVFVAVDEDDVPVGYLACLMHEDRFQIERMGVAKDERRIGAGTSLLSKIVWKLHEKTRSIIDVNVPWEHVGAMKFFAQMGFVSHGSDDDGVRMLYRLGWSPWADEGAASCRREQRPSS